ncbi:MAG: hypothetical protein ONB30_12435 [candidate division KSB1 bacterium]|nr:hypothetical protein [candidate division KSB1 bacterium]
MAAGGNRPCPAVVVPLHETGLEVVRALGRRGVPVIGVDADRLRPGSYSRYCLRFVRSATEGQGLVDTLMGLGAELGTKAVLFPCGDPQVLTVSGGRTLLEQHYLLPLPEESVVSTLMRKDLFATIAQELGYPIPRTFVAEGEARAEEIARKVRYPCILKPAVRTEQWERKRLPKNYLLHAPEGLMEAYHACAPFAAQVVVQEWIPGSDEDVYFCLVYFDQMGRPVASFTGRKLRQWPPQRGCTAVATGHTEAELEELTIRFLRQIGFRGLGSMEYRLDPRDGRFVMIEPTVGRIDLQSGVSELYGISFPWVAYADLAGLDVTVSKKPNGEAKWVHEEGTGRLFVRELWKRELSCRQWKRLLQGRRRYAVFAGDDWGPTCALFLDGLRRVGEGLVRGVFHKRVN